MATLTVAPMVAAAAYDGSAPLVCAVNTIMECDASGQCQRHTAQFPSLLRVNLHGGENGRGWAATIAEETGRMAASVVADEFTFALFGACTTP